MEGLTAQLANVARYGRTSRHLIWGLVVSLILDVTLTVFVSVIAVQANNASNTAQHAYASNVALCVAGNVSRQQNEGLWLFFLKLLGAPKEPAAIHAEALLRAELAKVFGPRNCAALGGKKTS
jgi:hypothetical protein